MNIHEFQAKKILAGYGVNIPRGKEAYSVAEAVSVAKDIGGEKWVVKAQIHAGGRGKAGGVKLIKSLLDLEKEANQMMGKILVTHQTGPEGKKVQRIYIEEASIISKEFYLSCLVDRESSKIAFISSTEGGMDIEKVAEEDSDKIITNKIDFKDGYESRRINVTYLFGDRLSEKLS